MNYDTHILELFNLLKDHIDKDTLQEYRYNHPYLSTETESSSGFLNHAFVWGHTKEGHTYWSRVNNNCPFRREKFSDSTIPFVEVYSRIIALYDDEQQNYEYW